MGAVGEPLHEGRPPARGAQQRLSDSEVIPDQVELRLPALREEDLVRVRNGHPVPGDVKNLRVRCQARTVPSAKEGSRR